jgi:hypothetical protein
MRKRGAFIEMPLNGFIYLFVLAAGDLVMDEGSLIEMSLNGFIYHFVLAAGDLVMDEGSLY